MKKFNAQMVIDYADKLLIGLTDSEVKMVLDEFEQIDKQIDLINDIPNIKEVEPMCYCLDNFSCHFREDIVEDSCDICDILRNSDDTLDRQIRVAKVVE